MIGRNHPKKSRLSTSTEKTSRRKNACSYQQLERRNLLATFVVNTVDDVVAEDGFVSLREAITATNTNRPFSDVGAGDEEGDRIVFSPEIGVNTHTLTEEFQILDDLIIRGYVDNNSGFITELSPDEGSRVFNIDTSERVYFRDLNLMFGKAEQGGLVNVNEGGNVIFKSSMLMSSSAEQGGAIHATDSRIVLDETVVLTNTATGEGGGVWASGGEILALQSTFNDNTAVEGGGIYLTNGTRLFANDVEMELNDTTADSGGGGAAIWSGEGTFVQINEGTFGSNGLAQDSDFPDPDPFDPNTITRGGAIAAFGDSLRIVDSEFVGNYASRGGAVYSTAPTSTLVNNVFDTNRAADDGGAGWFFSEDVRVIGGQAFFNSAGDRGGGFSFGNSLPEQNRAVVKNVMLYSNGAPIGGGISGTGDVRVIDSSFIENRASVPDGQAGTSRGGGIEIFGGDLLVLNTAFFRNVAQDFASQGGAISSFRSTTFIGDSTFDSNMATAGGAISALSVGDVTVRSTLFERNSATVGGAISAGGNSIVRSFDSTFLSNVATNRGGAIQAVGTSRFVARGTAFDSNQTTFGEGGAIFNHGTANISTSTFVNNRALRGGAIKVGGEGGLLSIIGQTEFTSNVAEANGSAISSTSGSITLINDANFNNNLVEDGFGDLLFVGDVTFHRVTNSDIG